MSIQIYRKLQLPPAEDLHPKSFYLVSPEGANKVDWYYVDAQGGVRTFLNESRVQEMLNQHSPATASIYAVETLAERDQLQLTQDSIVVVTGDLEAEDPDLPMTYLYVHSLTQFIMLSDGHIHEDLGALNALGITEEGELTVNGVVISTVDFAEPEW